MFNILKSSTYLHMLKFDYLRNKTYQFSSSYLINFFNKYERKNKDDQERLSLLPFNNYLRNIEDEVKNNLNTSLGIKMTTEKMKLDHCNANPQWEVKLSIKWPEKVSFSSISDTELRASNLASYVLLQHLIQKNMVCRLGSILLGNVNYKLNVPWCKVLLKGRTPSSDENQNVNNLNQHRGLLNMASERYNELMNSPSNERRRVGREREKRPKVSLKSGLFIKAFNDILKQNSHMNQPISYFSSISRPSESSLPKRSEVLESSSALRCAKGDDMRAFSEGNNLKHEPLDVGSVAKPLPINMLESNPFEVEAMTKPLSTNELQSKPFEVEVSKNSSPAILEGVKKEFPRPKETVHNFYTAVVQELKQTSYRPVQSYKLAPTAKGNKNTVTNWSCTWQVRWPTEASFTSVGRTKAEASNQVALEILHWLRAQGKLTSKGTPMIYTSQEVRELKRSPPEINLSPGWSQKILPLLQQFYQDIQPLLQDDVQEKVDNLEELDFPTDMIQPANRHPITGRDVFLITPKQVAKRCEHLYRQYTRRIEDPMGQAEKILKARQKLPIYKYQEELCDTVSRHRVVVVKGETGCGKSTQVPQFLMDEWSARRQGAYCNVVITQPRRISAIALANYVAREREERLGDVVGYQVRLQASLPHPDGGALFFCTTGILLRRLQSNPGLQGLSHVIVDEAHERDINTDLLLVMLRRALDLNPELRLIIMSATINAGLFQKYFEGAASLHVPGFTHPVESYFLDDLNIPGLHLNPSWCNAPNPSMDWREVAKVVSWVNQSQPPHGAILCFLPGWSEIEATSRALSDDPSLYVLRVHSRLPYDEQALIFQPPPDGLRKVILATNIAETSITVEDVVFVVDTGAHKENRLNEDKSMSSLDNQWVSQANVNQRRGRAGRVRPGKSFHLYTKDKYHRMEEFPIPEVLRVSLEKAVMDCKAFNDKEKAEAFMSEMPDPPLTEAVKSAVNELVELGVLDADENLTSLGKRIASFSSHPKISKALVYSTIFSCVSPVLTVGTILSGDADLFQGSLLDKERVRKSKSRLHTSSDHLALAWLYQEWAEHDRPMWFARDYRLNHNTCGRVKKLRRLLWQEVAQCMRLPEPENDCSADLDADWNRRAQHDELVKGVLLSGFNSLLYRRNWDMRHGRMKKNTNVLVTERNTFPSPYLTYFHQVHSEERRMVMIRETSMVSPLIVALFKPGNLTSHAYKDSSSTKDGSLTENVLLAIKGKRTVAMLCQKSDAEVICQLRETLWALVDYWVRRQGVAQLDPRVEHFQAVFLQTLSKVLHQAGRTIDYNEGDSQQLVQGR
uniref:ATP-dependent RNA helicase DHX30 n=1 Tax=Timema monikensis TaxID=170555 RepID=A0A7R9HKW6_9NEOP|nr:unnamed protein product [Timema monikensis]